VSLPEHPNKKRKTCNDLPWDLEGTIRDDYARHDPRAMFPEPSSTIPNATFTQQRVLEGIADPAMLGHEFAADPPHDLLPPEASVPFSEILKLSPAHPSDYAESSDPGRVPSDQYPSTAIQHQHGEGGPNLSQRSKYGPSVHVENALLPAGHDQSSVFAAPPMQVNWTESDTRNVSLLSSGSPMGPSKKQTCEQKSQFSTVNSEDDELAAIGLPQEQYKPRPSRSRSLKVDVDQSIDYSAKPEKSKKMPKRRRTTGGKADEREHTTPQKVKQICDMGFTPSSTARALEQNNGDVTQTVDWLVNNGVGEDELAPQSTPRQSSKVQQQTPAMDPETIQVIMRGLIQYRRDNPVTTHNVAATTVANSSTTQPQIPDNKIEQSTTKTNPETPTMKSPKVQVMIPSKSPKAEVSRLSSNTDSSKKKAKRRKTTLDQPEPDSTPLPTASVASKTKVEKKRGRGRPKKPATTTVSAEVQHEDLQETAAQDAPSEHHKQILAAIDPNAASGRVPEGDVEEGVGAQLHESVVSDIKLRASTPATTRVAEVTPTRTPERSTKTGSRSPKSKDKVAYRVGLSKRARIAPLLRTLKK
jgi:hypothetical protein